MSIGKSNFFEKTFISLGMWDDKKLPYDKSDKNIYFHCVPEYPHTLERALELMPDKFEECGVHGYSDHVSGIEACKEAVRRGAKYIEKHFTISNKLSGPDHQFSTNPKEFSVLVKQIREIESMLGKNEKKCQPSELEGLVSVRRGITALTNISKGTKITSNMVAPKRPATGIQPQFLTKVIGKVTKRNISEDESINWKDLR